MHLYFYVVHKHHYPAGLVHTAVSIPQGLDDSPLPYSIVSHSLSADKQFDKLIALKSMFPFKSISQKRRRLSKRLVNTLKHAIDGKKPSIYGVDSDYHRFVRSDELFIAYHCNANDLAVLRNYMQEPLRK